MKLTKEQRDCPLRTKLKVISQLIFAQCVGVI